MEMDLELAELTVSEWAVRLSHEVADELGVRPEDVQISLRFGRGGWAWSASVRGRSADSWGPLGALRGLIESNQLAASA